MSLFCFSFDFGGQGSSALRIELYGLHGNEHRRPGYYLLRIASLHTGAYEESGLAVGRDTICKNTVRYEMWTLVDQG